MLIVKIALRKAFSQSQDDFVVSQSKKRGICYMLK